MICVGLVNAEVKMLSMRPFIENPEDYTYSRGRYLIILGNNAFSTLISSEEYFGNFVKLKTSQGYDVDVRLYSDISPSNSITELKDSLELYSDIDPLLGDPLLEYVLLVGDVSGFAEIGTHRIPSYNEMEQDATDYPYTFFSEDEMYNPRFFIGRWSISDVSEFLSIKKRTIDYESINGTENLEYLNKALLVAGSYKTDAGAVPVPPEYWPVTPYWTSLWIQDELESETFMVVDTALFHAHNQVTTTIDIVNPWNEGIGIVNYRGWGNATGWTKPQFKVDDINYIINDFTVSEMERWLQIFERDEMIEMLTEKQAFKKSMKGLSLSSDAFFPFRDNIDYAFRFGVNYILNPGGSVSDTEIIGACNEYKICMAISGKRLFLH